jgi:hypothetical protein
MEERPSSDYQWRFLTASALLETGPCELVSAEVVPSATTTTTIIYDGTDATGKKVIQFNITIVLNWPFKPPEPIYCDKGLYVVVGSDVTGIFVQWRKLSSKAS